jgi:hypothetical protein
MILLARLVPLLAAAVLAADTPADPAPGASTSSAGTAALATDDDIRATFVGRAACPPEPWPVSFGPFEFRPDGSYFRAQDIVSAHGRYVVSGGKICVTIETLSLADFCLAVIKSGGTYAFRIESSAAGAPVLGPLPVTPCPLPQR